MKESLSFESTISNPYYLGQDFNHEILSQFDALKPIKKKKNPGTTYGWKKGKRPSKPNTTIGAGINHTKTSPTCYPKKPPQPKS